MYLIITIIAGGFVWFLSRLATQAPIERDGKSLLEINKIFGALGVLLMALGLFTPFYSFLIIDDFSTAGIIITVSLLLSLSGLGYWLFMWHLNHKVIFNETDIIVIDSRKRIKKIQWTDINHIEFNTWASKYILTLKTNEKIMINQYLTGIEEFMKKVKSALADNQQELKSAKGQ